VKLCYGVSVANITVTVPDDIYRRARVRAAEKGTSVSSLVRDFLSSLDGSDVEFRRLAALQDEILSQIGQFRATDRLTRDEAHDRAVR
jgi:plasmid stability protein